MKPRKGSTTCEHPAEISSRHQQLPEEVESILDALENFVAAESWNEAKEIVETRRKDLLNDKVDDVLETLISHHSDQDTVRFLSRYHRILIRCRVVGIDAAFAELLSGDSPRDRHAGDGQSSQYLMESYVAMVELLSEFPDITPVIHYHIVYTMSNRQRRWLFAMDQLMAATSYAEIRMLLTLHPILLTLETDLWLGEYVDRLAQRGELSAAAIVSDRRWLLASCRINGIDAALARHTPVQDGIRIAVEGDQTHQWIKDWAQTA